MIELIKSALEKGAKLVGNISGGKDGQAMVRTMVQHGMRPDHLVHCDLGTVEWPESIAQCRKQSTEENIPLEVLKRADGRGLLEHWKHRMHQLQGQSKPFWSSSTNRYCTSDLKRDVVDKWIRSRNDNLIISCEGIRAQESKARAKKVALSIRSRITSTYYAGMTVEEAIANYHPEKRLALTWYPIFNYSIADVWQTYGLKEIDLIQARESYLYDGKVPAWWLFHPAYVYGNDRVSCMICILGSENDIANGIKHNPALYQEMVAMEEYSGYKFRQSLELKTFDITT